MAVRPDSITTVTAPRSPNLPRRFPDLLFLYQLALETERMARRYTHMSDHDLASRYLDTELVARMLRDHLATRLDALYMVQRNKRAHRNKRPKEPRDDSRPRAVPRPQSRKATRS